MAKERDGLTQMTFLWWLRLLIHNVHTLLMPRTVCGKRCIFCGARRAAAQLFNVWVSDYFGLAAVLLVGLIQLASAG